MNDVLLYNSIESQHETGFMYFKIEYVKSLISYNTFKNNFGSKDDFTAIVFL